MKKYSNSPSATEVFFAWEAEINPNALAIDDDSGQLYMATSRWNCKTFTRGRPVTIAEALEWFVETSKQSGGSYEGSIAPLCEAAAKEIRLDNKILAASGWKS